MARLSLYQTIEIRQALARLHLEPDRSMDQDARIRQAFDLTFSAERRRRIGDLDDLFLQTLRAVDTEVAKNPKAEFPGAGAKITALAVGLGVFSGIGILTLKAVRAFR